MFQCNDLFTLSSLSRLKLLAGKNGLHRGIRWVYKAESLHLSQWVHGGELLIISKLVTLEPDFDLTAILKEAIGLNMSGALLLVGPNYVETISRSALNLCNVSDFPLFAIPWNLPLVDFFEEIGHAIANNNLHQNRGRDIILNIIFENNISADILKLQAIDAGYPVEGSHCFFLLHLALPGSGQSAGMEQSAGTSICSCAQQFFSEAGLPVLASNYSNHIIGILPADDIDRILSVFRRILRHTSSAFPEIKCNIGIGLAVPEMTLLRQSYEQAAKCITYCIKTQKENQILTYSQLGLYQLFSDFNHTDALNAFVNSQLGPLIEYDAANHTQLIETLYSYLQNNCNLLHTADDMFTHRNTIKYRLARIKEITQRDLEDASVRLNFHTALYIKKYVL